MSLANVLLGNTFEYYDLEILHREPKEPGIVSETVYHIYEITSVSGTMVSDRLCNAVRRHNLFVRFVFSTFLSAITVMRKTDSTWRVS